MNPPIPSAPPAVRSRPAPLPPVGPRHRVPPPHTTDPRRRWRLQSQSGTASWELGALWAQWGHIQAWPGSVRKVWAGSGYCGRHGRVQGPPGRRARLRARSQVGRAGRMRPGAPALRAELRAETQAAAFRFLPEDQLSVSRSPTRGQPWRSLAEGRGLRGVLKPGSAGRRTAP